MNSRSVGLLFVSLMVSTSVGCFDRATPPVAAIPAPAAVPASVVFPQVKIEPLTAEQLATILGVQVWTAKYSGGPIECWLEIEEEGQATLPKRIPEVGFVGSSVSNPPSEGTIEFWWTRREDRAGGEFHLKAGNGGFGYGLSKDAFTFSWQSFGARSTPTGSGEAIRGKPGIDFIIVDYDASEVGEIRPGATRRRVHLKLMGRFARPSEDCREGTGELTRFLLA